MFSLAEITSSYRAKLIIEVYKKWINRDENVLDIGCGNGVVSIKLKKELKVNLTGCDIINYVSHDIPFVKMQKTGKLPFKDKMFDVAMFNDVLHHTSKVNQPSLLREAMRVAKRVVIFEVNPTFSGKIFDYLMNKIHNPSMNIPFTFRSINNWHTLFKKNGYVFEVKQVRQPLFYPFKHIAFLLED